MKDCRHNVPWATTRTSFVDFDNLQQGSLERSEPIELARVLVRLDHIANPGHKRESRHDVSGCTRSFGSRSRTGRKVLFSGCAILDRLHPLRGFVSLLWRDQYCHSRPHGCAGIDGERQGCCVHVARQLRNDYEVVASKGIVVSFKSSARSLDYLLGSFAALRPASLSMPFKPFANTIPESGILAFARSFLT